MLNAQNENHIGDYKIILFSTKKPFIWIQITFSITLENIGNREIGL